MRRSLSNRLLSHPFSHHMGVFLSLYIFSFSSLPLVGQLIRMSNVFLTIDSNLEQTWWLSDSKTSGSTDQVAHAGL